jgi:hypothetical protein
VLPLKDLRDGRSLREERCGMERSRVCWNYDRLHVGRFEGSKVGKSRREMRLNAGERWPSGDGVHDTRERIAWE